MSELIKNAGLKARRTFAIILPPDVGKTPPSLKNLLLFGNAIQLAGSD